MHTHTHRNLQNLVPRVREGNYTLSGLVGFELSGKTYGVVGTGKIGIEMIKVIKPFAAKILTYDVYESDEAKALGAWCWRRAKEGACREKAAPCRRSPVCLPACTHCRRRVHQPGGPVQAERRGDPARAAAALHLPHDQRADVSRGLCGWRLVCAAPSLTCHQSLLALRAPSQAGGHAAAQPADQLQPRRAGGH